MGTDEEKAKYVKNILSGEEIWCQGFSEPDHGSDLGAVQTRAVRDGDDYVVNESDLDDAGQLRRPHDFVGADQYQHRAKIRRAIVLLSPMKIEGVEAHPIRKVTGEYGFNQTFFTDARIPASCLMVKRRRLDCCRRKPSNTRGASQQVRPVATGV